MLQRLMKTGDSSAVFFIRIALGSVMLVHGLQQVFGMFHGTNISQKMAYYEGSFGVPPILAFLGVMTVSVGAILLIIGFWGRLMALFIGAFMVTAALLNHVENGFFMNWEGHQAGEGYEYHILAVGMALALIIYGSGKFSIDRWWVKKIS